MLFRVPDEIPTTNFPSHIAWPPNDYSTLVQGVIHKYFQEFCAVVLASELESRVFFFFLKFKFMKGIGITQEVWGLNLKRHLKQVHIVGLAEISAQQNAKDAPKTYTEYSTE